MYTLDMSLLDLSHPISVTEASQRGVAGLIKDAEAGEEVMVSRHGKTVAAVVSARLLEQLRTREGDLRDAALVIVRAATDSGVRGSLDEALTAFGLDRAQLETELDADLAAGRP